MIVARITKHEIRVFQFILNIQFVCGAIFTLGITYLYFGPDRYFTGFDHHYFISVVA